MLGLFFLWGCVRLCGTGFFFGLVSEVDFDVSAAGSFCSF